jgi:hypothetical protein
MAKKKTIDETSEEISEIPVGVNTDNEPYWGCDSARPVRRCLVELAMAGPEFVAYAEVTELEEHTTKDLSILKRERLREAVQAVYDKAMEYLHG